MLAKIQKWGNIETDEDGRTNIPGLFAGGDIATGLAVAVAIGLQNMPEGLAVAAPLVREGYSRKYFSIFSIKCSAN